MIIQYNKKERPNSNFKINILPAMAITSPCFDFTSTVTSDKVCPGVGITLTLSFITYSSPVTENGRHQLSKVD